MEISKIILNAIQLSGTVDAIAFLLEVRDRYKYVNGKRTDETEGVNAVVVFPNNGYDKVSVKMKNCTITEEQIAKNGGQLKVKFKNLTGKLYRMSNGELAISASADGLEVIQ